MEFNAEKEPAWFPESKIYFNGSQYIAIPHTTRRYKKRPKKIEKIFVLPQDDNDITVDGAVKPASVLPKMEIMDDDECPDCPFEAEIEAYYAKKKDEKMNFNADMVPSLPKKERKSKFKRVTRGGEFNRLYEESKDMKKKERRTYLLNGMRRLFANRSAAETYVDNKILDKERALFEKKQRFERKARQTKFNYFVTFTYANEKHTEDTFREKLSKSLRNYATKYDWKYMGVWERGGENERLHFHALVKIPDGTMPGELIKVNDFNLKTKRPQKTIQNTHFNKKFGRTDFKEVIQDDHAFTEAIGYILKYIGKTNEKIVYSRGLPMYFISDVNSDDVMARTGVDGRKLILSKDFKCWDQGEYLGEMSEETKQRMRSTTC